MSRAYIPETKRDREMRLRLNADIKLKCQIQNLLSNSRSEVQFRRSAIFCVQNFIAGQLLFSPIVVSLMYSLVIPNSKELTLMSIATNYTTDRPVNHFRVELQRMRQSVYVVLRVDNFTRPSSQVFYCRL